MNSNSEWMSWQDKLDSVKKLMEILDQVNTKKGDREQELLDVLILVAKLLLSCQNVNLSRNNF